MTKKIYPSVTSDEAIARIVNVDYIPEGFTLLDMTAAFLEEAETDYENARFDGIRGDQKSMLSIRADICEMRHQLAQQLLNALELELASPNVALTVAPDKGTGVVHFGMDSIVDWAFDKFGIGFPSWQEACSKSTSEREPRWEDVTIKIYANYSLGVQIGNGNFRRYTFTKLGLMGQDKKLPNHVGGALICLSRKVKYPGGSSPMPADKTKISKLRKCLVDLTQIKSDPFHPINPADGWRPRFELIDDQNNAANRAREKALRSRFFRDPDNESADAQGDESQDGESEYDEEIGTDRPMYTNSSIDPEHSIGADWLAENDPAVTSNPAEKKTRKKYLS